ncbi:amino acid ABC transporter permease [Microvirga brassicacearum]|uniref:Amino acid ABC transporter permease n=1 Tax=Microvirga brassicacearum TaxID=2580413 RepID=A0A5N3PFT9_9HYPH|nr:amino acid ABC transporter permease [Microvirga brassicacearum]KAB0268617.1 amino acid ABC transporter permease [Microvirga brassicacearum]
MKYGLQFRDVFAAWEAFLDGVLITLVLSFAAMLGGLLIGISFAAGRVYGPPILRRIVVIYVDVIRNTPLLVQLFLIFFGLPSLGVRLDGMTAAIIALVINLGAYTTEIVRAGLEAVPRVQIEAGSSLGLSNFQVFRYVVLFPALKAMVPALASQFVLLMLATSIVSQISVPDLFHAASIVQSRTFRDFEVYTVIGVLYLALAFLFRGIFALLYQRAFARR